MPSSADAQPKIVKNSLFGLVGQAAGGLLAFAAFVLIARQLGVQRFGILSFLVAFTSVFQLGATLGLVNILIREISQQRERVASIMGRAIPLVALLSLVVLGAMFAAIGALDLDEEARQAAYLLGVSTILSINAVVCGVVSRAFEDMGYNAFATVSQRLVLLALVAVGLHTDAGLRGFASAYAAASAYQLLFFFVLIHRRYARPAWEIDVQYWRFLLGESLPLGIGLLFRRLTLHVDTLLLGLLSTTAAIGLFSAAYRAINVVEVLPLTLALPLYPALVRAAREGSLEGFFALCRTAQRWFFLLALPIVVWLVLVGPALLVRIYGERFDDGALTLLPLSLSVLFLFPNALYAQIFAALGRQRRFLALAAFALAVNLVADAILIPWWQHRGAALGTLTAEVALFLGGAVSLYGLGYRGRYASLLPKPVLAASVAGLPLLWLPDGVPLPLLVLASAAFGLLYLLILLLLRAVRPGELQAFRRALAPARAIAEER